MLTQEKGKKKKKKNCRNLSDIKFLLDFKNRPIAQTNLFSLKIYFMPAFYF